MTSYLDVPTSTALGDNGISYSYRQFGNASARPLVLLQHFRGNLDNWDPALLDALARDRVVVAFDNTGVGSSTGDVPHSVTQMAHDAIGFIAALGLEHVDILGYSLGGFVAQEIALIRPDLVERIVLAATAPQGAAGMHGWVNDIIDAVGSPQTTGDQLLHAFFTESSVSRTAGGEFLGPHLRSLRRPRRGGGLGNSQRPLRRSCPVGHSQPQHARTADSDHPSRIRRQRRQRPNDLAPLQPSSGGLAAQRCHQDLSRRGHGFLFQHHSEFADDVSAFLRDR